jgi:hypothetical protein
VNADAGAEAARRLLAAAAAGAPFEAEGALLLAAAGALAGPAPMEDPGLALVVAAGAGAPREELAALALAVPPAERAGALSVAERLLARIDPRWTWELITELVGAEAAVQAALGLDLAARLDLDHGQRWDPGVPVPGVYARQLAADAAARDLVRAGPVPGARDDERLAALHGRKPGRGLYPSEARVLLVAAAAVDPAWALEVATGMLDTFGPEDLRASFRLVADAAVRAGLGDGVVAKAHEDGFVSEQATWAAAAASAGALGGAALVELAQELAFRAEDELDPGRELVAGLPLLEALAHGGQADPLTELAGRWLVPPPLLVDQLFHAEAAKGAALLVGHPGLDRILDEPEAEWAQLYHYGFCWWTGAGADRAAAVVDALAVTAACPWRPLPGSLADLVGWPGRASAP